MWFFLALTTAIFTAVTDVLAKKAGDHFNSYIRSWGIAFFSLPLVLLMSLFIDIPLLDITFWITLLITLLIGIVSSVLYMKAIHISPLSLTLPMLAFSPLFILISSTFINGEVPSRNGIIGVLMILVGTYLLNFDFKTKKILSPFWAMKKEKGVLYMLCVTLLWGVGASFDKLAVVHSSALSFNLIYTVAYIALLAPISYLSSPRQFKLIFNVNHSRTFLLLGCLSALATVSQLLAINMTFVAYAISIKRLSILFGALLGWYFFKEPLKERIGPILLMFLGIILIAFA